MTVIPSRSVLTSTSEKLISTSDLTNPPHPSISWEFTQVRSILNKPINGSQSVLGNIVCVFLCDPSHLSTP